MHALLLWKYDLKTINRSVISDSATPQDFSTPGFPVHHQLPESTQTHLHRVSDAMQPSHPLSPAWVSCIAGGFFTPEPPGRPYQLSI